MSVVTRLTLSVTRNETHLKCRRELLMDSLKMSILSAAMLTLSVTRNETNLKCRRELLMDSLKMSSECRSETNLKCNT